MAEPVSWLVDRKRQRVRRAAQAAVTLEAELRRLTALPSPGEEGLIVKLQELLASRIAERDDARRDLEELETRPGWRREQRLSAARV